MTKGDVQKTTAPNKALLLVLGIALVAIIAIIAVTKQDSSGISSATNAGEAQGSPAAPSQPSGAGSVNTGTSSQSRADSSSELIGYWNVERIGTTGVEDIAPLTSGSAHFIFNEDGTGELVISGNKETTTYPFDWEKSEELTAAANDGSNYYCAYVRSSSLVLVVTIAPSDSTTIMFLDSNTSDLCGWAKKQGS